MAKNKRPELPKNIEIKCNEIIHGASVAAAAAGAAGAQIPLIENAVITLIQIRMIIMLAKIFDRNLTKEAALGVLKGASAALLWRRGSQIFVFWIPGFGNMINAAAAASFTEAVGRMSAGQFYDEWLKEGHTPEDCPESMNEESEESRAEKAQTKTHREELMEQADLFINGQKDAKGADKDEFFQLFNEMSYEMAYLSEDDPFREKYEKLTKCLK